MTKKVVVLDYGSGNVHSAVRMLERVGADVELTADQNAVQEADGLFVPGVGNFHACMKGLNAVDGGGLIRKRLADSRPVIGVCVGMQVLFEGSTEPATQRVEGLGIWSGTVDRLRADVVPHMGWSQVEPESEVALFAGVEGERFYFVHSYAAPATSALSPQAVRVIAEHGEPFVAAANDGALSATQFHPEKSGDAGARLLTNWVSSL